MEQQAFFLEYLPMELSLMSLEAAVLPEYLGSTLRGAIGQALHANAEAYQYLFDNRSIDGPRREAVNPYIIVPPLRSETAWKEGEELRVNMLLFGGAARYAQVLISALGRNTIGLGFARNPFAFVKVAHTAHRRILWQNGRLNPIAAQSVALPCLCLPDVRSAIINICTPLRIRRNGEFLENIDFPIIIRNITKRLQSIVSRYGGWIDEAEAARVQRLSKEVVMLENKIHKAPLQRYASRLHEKMDFSGLMGSVRFAGDITPFVPWLYAAKIIHIGCNTTFGMGRIEVEFI